VLLGSITGVFAQNTYVPDNNFEQALIQLGLDDVMDDSVATASINTVTNLDISNKWYNDNGLLIHLSDLTGIEDFTSLDTLNCKYNRIKVLDLSLNTNLKILYCTNNAIGTLKANSSIEELYCTKNALKSLDLNAYSNLKVLDCAENYCSRIDVSNNPVLSSLNLGYNGLSRITLRSNHTYSNLNLEYNWLNESNIDLSTVTVENLNISRNYFRTLNLKNTFNTSLVTINAKGNIYLDYICVDNVEKANLGEGVYANWEVDDQISYTDDCYSEYYTWVGGVIGEWNSAENWSKDEVPNSVDANVVIDGGDNAIKVTVPYEYIVGSISLSSNSSLELLDGSTLEISAKETYLVGDVVVEKGANLITKSSALQHLTNRGKVTVNGDFTCSLRGNANGVVSVTGTIYNPYIIEGTVSCSMLDLVHHYDEAAFYGNTSSPLTIIGKLTGDISTCSTLDIQKGGSVSGKITMLTEEGYSKYDSYDYFIQFNSSLTVSGSFSGGLEYINQSYDNSPYLLFVSGGGSMSISSFDNNEGEYGVDVQSGTLSGQVNGGSVRVRNGAVFGGTDYKSLHVYNGGTYKSYNMSMSGDVTLDAGAILEAENLKISSTSFTTDGENFNVQNITIGDGGSLGYTGDDFELRSLTIEKNGNLTVRGFTTVTGDIGLSRRSRAVFEGSVSCNDFTSAGETEVTDISVGDSGFGKKLEGLGNINVTGGNLTIKGSAVCEVFDISEGVVVIDVNGKVTANTFQNLGSLEINSTSTQSGSLISNTDVSKVTYNRSVAAGTWHLIGSPVADASVDFNGINKEILAYDEAVDNWVTPGDISFVSGLGYAIKSDVNNSASFTGKAISTSLSDIALTRDGEGWNILSNPYPSA
ncbi:MAG: hypothetical protein KAH32_08380, partial [Chlamydiia bacterium]|nr:hypothetical protein [Chlamydiia bacterium]